MKEPRPYWVDLGIQTIDGSCKLEYASPATHTFDAMFLGIYLVYNHTVLYKAKSERNYTAVIISGSLVCVFIAGSIILELLFGVNYINQNIVSIIYSLMAINVATMFDKDLSRFAERAGFLLKPSRKYKFYVLFIYLALFIFAMMINAGMGDSWDNNFMYVQNAIV